MNKICTSIEQTKKLIELGIDINTADLTIIDLPIQNGDRFKFISSKLPNDTFPSITDGKSEKVPAWSLSVLMNLFDDKAGLAKEYGLWYCYDNGKSHCTKHYENQIDAAFEMICWLKENEKI